MNPHANAPLRQIARSAVLGSVTHGALMVLAAREGQARIASIRKMLGGLLR